MGIVIEFPKNAAVAPMFVEEVRELLIGAPGVWAMSGAGECDMIRRKMREVLPHADASTVSRCTDLMVRMRAIMREAVPL